MRPAGMFLIGRRTVLAGLGAGVVASTARAAEPAPVVRLGVLQFGTVQWVSDVIRRHDLDTRHGFALQTVKLANTDAGRVALMAGSVDVVVSDWMFVAAQRAAGTQLCFAPFTSASGGVITAGNSQLGTLAELRGRKLGVAGGPADKSWILVQAAARTSQSVDLASTADVIYGAPPLLGAKLQQGELDAVLTYWNFAAKLQAAGFREMISVGQCAAALGLPSPLSMVGFVFRQAWGEANRQAVDGFLAASADAEQMLLRSDAEWQQVRPLMEAENDAVFTRLLQRFREGVAHPDAAAEERSAARVFAILRETGGSRATGGVDALPPGMFWPVRDAAG